MGGYRERIARIAACDEYPLKKILIYLLEVYKVCISPYVPTQCRFYPTCSTYMQEAIQKKGVLRGLACGLKRILRCNPFSRGGYDPVK